MQTVAILIFFIACISLAQLVLGLKSFKIIKLREARSEGAMEELKKATELRRQQGLLPSPKMFHEERDKLKGAPTSKGLTKKKGKN